MVPGRIRSTVYTALPPAILYLHVIFHQGWDGVFLMLRLYVR